MASACPQNGINIIVTGTLSFTVSTFKIMLVNTTFVFAKTYTFVDDGTTNNTCAKQQEINCTNYTRGFGGSGRKANTITTALDNSGNRCLIKFTNQTWSALGGASNDTVGGALLIHEITADTSSQIIAYWALTSTPTNGSDFTLSFDATNGNIQFNC